MKVLIVDDEALSRAGIRTIIPWEQHGYQVVGEASNGVEALNIAKASKPDIALVDIVMPEMDGLDFITRLREELPTCKFIILSCMNDISYYKHAIRLGVSEYVQKSSATADEILRAVNGVSEQIRKERVYDGNEDYGKAHINRYVILTEFLNEVLKGQIKDPRQIEKKFLSYAINFPSHTFHIAVLSLGQDERENRDDIDEYSIINLCQQIINNIGKGFVFKNYEDKITAIISCPDDEKSSMFVKELCDSIQDTFDQCLDLKFTIGLSDTIREFPQINQGYRQALESLSRSFFQGEDKIYPYNTGVNEESKELWMKIQKDKQAILDIRSPFDTENFMKYIKSISQRLASQSSSTPHQARRVYMDILYHIISLLHNEKIDIKDITGTDFDPIKYIEAPQYLYKLDEQMEELLSKIKDFYRIDFKQQQISIIVFVRQYIEEHIGEKISLESIAKKVHLSPNYLSRFYREKTGETLQDYILRVRVEKSKEMLANNRSLSDIASALGFASMSHFIKVFRSYTNLTPKQYMKRIRE